MDRPLTIADYEAAFRDHQRLVREIDVIINGDVGAAKQASLCDLVGQIRILAGDMARAAARGHAYALGMRDVLTQVWPHVTDDKAFHAKDRKLAALLKRLDERSDRMSSEAHAVKAQISRS